MSDLVTDQFRRLLERLPQANPWPVLEASGFLDLLRPEGAGGGGLQLEDVFPLALAVGALDGAPPVLETMIARIVTPTATAVEDAERALAEGGVGAEGARALAAALAAAQMAGAMAHLLEITVGYATTRRQFGREIGRFQAVQQQVAVMAEEVLAARMAAQAALRGAPLGLSILGAAVAKARTGQAAALVASVAHAVHGAIGISQDLPLHRFTTRLRRWRFAHGGDSYWNIRLGRAALAAEEDVLSLARDL